MGSRAAGGINGRGDLARAATEKQLAGVGNQTLLLVEDHVGLREANPASLAASRLDSSV